MILIKINILHFNIVKNYTYILILIKIIVIENKISSKKYNK